MTTILPQLVHFTINTSFSTQSGRIAKLGCIRCSWKRSYNAPVNMDRLATDALNHYRRDHE